MKCNNIIRSLLHSVITYSLSILYVICCGNILPLLSGELSGLHLGDRLILFFILNTHVFLSIIIIPTRILWKNDHFTISCFLTIAAVLHILFIVYAPPFLYLLVFTDEVTGIINLFSLPHKINALLISVQFSLIILISTRMMELSANNDKGVSK